MKPKEANMIMITNMMYPSSCFIFIRLSYNEVPESKEKLGKEFYFRL